MAAEAERLHISQIGGHVLRGFSIKLNGTSLPVIEDGRLISRSFADSTQNAILIQKWRHAHWQWHTYCVRSPVRWPFLCAGSFPLRSARLGRVVPSSSRGFLCERRSRFPRVRVDVRQLFIAAVSSALPSAPQFAKRSDDAILSGTL